MDETVIREPFTTFRHHLYVSPMSADFHTTAHRNIACRVEFMETEGSYTTEPQGIACVYNKYSASKLRHATTTVTYHSKVRLPFGLILRFIFIGLL